MMKTELPSFLKEAIVGANTPFLGVEMATAGLGSKLGE
jgi:hypothetical protein